MPNHDHNAHREHAQQKQNDAHKVGQVQTGLVHCASHDAKFRMEVELKDQPGHEREHHQALQEGVRHLKWEEGVRVRKGVSCTNVLHRRFNGLASLRLD